MIFAALLLGAAAITMFPATGVYRYTASMGGQNIGSWSVNVSTDTASAELDERSAATVMGMQVTAAASLVLGPDLSPLKYTGDYRTPMQSPSVSVDLTSESATATGALNAKPQQIGLQPGTHHFVVVEPGLLAGLFALPAQLAAWKEATVTWITPATAQAQTLAVRATGAGTRPPDVPNGDAILSVERPIAVTVWYDPTTFVPDEIDVPSENAVLRRLR